MNQDLRQAEAIAREAGKLLLRHFRSSTLQTSAKGYLDVVTEADTETERLIVERLTTAFPEDAVVGEEGTKTESANGRTWFIDPLDGPPNFSRGIPFWCVSIGLAQSGEPSLGVVFDPVRDELYAGRQGGGASLNGVPIHVSSVTDPLAATLQLTLNYDRVVIEQSIRDFNAVARSVMRLRNMGALALELAYIACGRLDAVCQRGSHPWDYAAAMVLCREAGAAVTDAAGHRFELSTDHALVAATPELHRALLDLLRE